MSLLDSVRRPEYTGEGRCWPCTAVNAFVVVVAAGVLSVLSVPVGVLALGVGTALVYLRGYVVPGTPAFAPRLVASLGLQSLFPHADGEARRSDDLTDEEVDGEELIVVLLETGVLAEAPDGALELSAEFAESWEREMAALREWSDEELAEIVADAAPFEASGEHAYGGLSIEGPTRAVWLSRVHGIADAAAIRALAAAGVPERYRAYATTPLRMFVETCPDCGGDVVETTRSDCCGGSGSVYDSPIDEVLACEDCGAVVYRFDETVDDESASEEEGGPQSV
ncbi:zinc finger-like domain-containing protein [Halopelagius longus]|uniref:Uncharacterized protein n=1 Tax=Halopelagius longus TaxID=1236180 RepID=A0A1H0Z054_9EURY|nr:zinc finger-like domain-containing protein [Halopelagius longus]RDI72748.1 hypothetical protein DWB78_14015 [Halopelagius longus]SDQ20476.1 hypothetical protein SAMN05216278_0924 [Halopelagius longus]